MRASQGGRAATAFDRSIAGNPTGRGVPHSALGPTLRSQGRLALVASLWRDGDLSWLDGAGCNRCNLDQAEFSLKLL